MSLLEQEEKPEIFNGLVLLVDVQNLFYSARDAYGLAARVDFKKLKQLAMKNRRFRHIVSFAYLAATMKDIPSEFVSALEKLSYEVKIANIRAHETGPSSATDIDVMLATDATITKIGTRDPDIVVVASGDSDYVPVYQALRDRGVRVEIVAFRSTLSAAVEEIAHSVTYLTREHLYNESFQIGKGKDGNPGPESLR